MISFVSTDVADTPIAVISISTDNDEELETEAI
jgi:hypothetical protein